MLYYHKIPAKWLCEDLPSDFYVWTNKAVVVIGDRSYIPPPFRDSQLDSKVIIAKLLDTSKEITASYISVSDAFLLKQCIVDYFLKESEFALLMIYKNKLVIENDQKQQIEFFNMKYCFGS